MTDTVQTLRQQLLQLRTLHATGVLGDAQYAKSRAPLERKLVDLLLDAPAGAASSTTAAAQEPVVRPGRRLWAGLGVFAVLLAAAGYWWTGAPGLVGQPPAGFGASAGNAADAPPMTKDEFIALTARLAARLKEKPDDAEGWRMLGRSYMALDRVDEALPAYQQSLKLKPDDAGTLADYADALAVKNGRSLDGEPMQLIERALKLDPDNVKALTLAGSAAFNRNDFARAAQLWDRAAQVGPPDSPIAQQARSAANEAREMAKRAAAEAAGGGAAAASAVVAGSPAGPVPAAAAGGPGLAGTVTLAPALKAKASPDDTVFIFARPADGARMPLAIVRKQVKDLPFEFKLDDTQAMSPATRLSTMTGPVIVGARISKSGQAMPQPGDLEGLSAPVAVGSRGVAVTIANEIK